MPLIGKIFVENNHFSTLLNLAYPKHQQYDNIGKQYALIKLSLTNSSTILQLIGSRRWRIDLCRFRWPWVIFDPDFKGIIFFEVWKTARLRDNTNRKLYVSIGTMFGDLDWPLNASRGFVGISWASCWQCNKPIRFLELLGQWSSDRSGGGWCGRI